MTNFPPIDPWVGPLVRGLLQGEHHNVLEPLRLQDPDGAAGALPRLPPREADFDRSALATSIAEFNRAIGHPESDALAAQLGDPATEVVVTGQQAGLFGGPIYALSKAIAATLWARRLTSEGRPAVAVFWIASEDHDFEEVRSASFGSQTVSVAAEEDSTRPVGERLINEQLLQAVEDAIGECGSAINAPPFLPDALALGRECYVEGEPFSLGFARLLPKLLGEHCPLLLDSQDPVLKPSQAKWSKRLVRRSVAAIAALEERERAINAAGFDLQIGSARQTDGGYALPLFLHREGCRYRVVLDPPAGESGPSAGYSLRGYDERGTMEDLVARVESQPSLTSPSAVLRPLLQDACLGTTLQILGPGELAYVPQAAPLYEVLEVAAPTVALRPQAVFLPERVEKQYREMIKDSALEPAQILGPWAQLEGLLAERADNGTLEGIALLSADTLAGLEALATKAKALDPGLDAALAKTRDHLERGFANFRSRAEKAGAQKASVLNGRIEKLRDLALPEGKLQERKLCSLWLAAQFGRHACDQIVSTLSLDARRLQVLPISIATAPTKTE